MYTFLSIIQVLCSIAMIAAIILHPAKGTGMGGIGGPAQVFGSQKGAEKGLNQITAAVAAIWAVSAVLLTMPNVV